MSHDGETEAGQETRRESALARGDRMRDTGHWAEAVMAYGEHLAENPQDFGIWVQQGNCAKEAYDFATAHEAYVSALKLRQDDADLYLQLGHLYKLINRRVDAIRAYGMAYKLDRRLTDARNEMAALKTGKGDDFILPMNVLDTLSAGSLEELLREAEGLRNVTDPFAAYRELIDS